MAELHDGGEPRGARRGRPLLALAVVVTLLVAVGLVVRLPGVARLAGTAITGPGPSAGPGGTPEQRAFEDGGRAVLATMTDAVRRRDAERFVSVAAADRPAVRAHLRRVFAALEALPIAGFGLALDPGGRSEPASGLPPGATTLPTLASYHLAGWDDTPLAVPLLLVVAPAPGGRWGVVDDRTTTDAGTDQRLEPWLFDGVTVTRTAHVLVVGDHAHAAQARRLARTLEGLVADVRRVWPERTWNGKVVAYAMTSRAFVRSWYGRSAAGDPGNGDRAAFVAKVVTLTAQAGGVGAVRLVLTPYLLRRPPSGSVDVLRHELTHVATARLGGGVPTWLVEGAAEYTGFARHRADGSLDALTTLGRHGLTGSEVTSTANGTWRPALLAYPDFYTGTEAAVDEHYNSAFITCLYIADHDGEAALRRLYERSAAIGGSSPAGRVLVPATEAAALSQVLHTTRARLVRAVGAYATSLRSRLVFP